jgi:hypothetical protein
MPSLRGQDDDYESILGAVKSVYQLQSLNSGATALTTTEINRIPTETHELSKPIETRETTLQPVVKLHG